MRAYLVRVGIDQAFGGWNAPVDPVTGAFVYVPIPEKAGTAFQPGLAKSYEPFRAALAGFTTPKPLPDALLGLHPHLDPDFDALTYGDNGLRRGKGLCDLIRDDVVVFFAGMRPTITCEHNLIYAIIGLYRVAEAVRLRDIPRDRWADNAHTRKLTQGPDDIIIRAQPDVSGRLERAITIGEFRDKAYRVRRDLLATWGDLSCRDGFIQRSAVPPAFKDPARFLSWFAAQSPTLLAANNPAVATAPSQTSTVIRRSSTVMPSSVTPAAMTPATPVATKARPPSRSAAVPPVILVHLRQPKRSEATESRTDPVYEYGMFGATGCHNANLLRDTSRTGVRLGFIQPGRNVMRLVFLTPPITVINHGKRRVAHWKPAHMPLHFKHGILLIDQDGNSDIPGIKVILEGGQRSTWVSRFSSAFRSRTTPLSSAIAAAVVAAWNHRVATGGPAILAKRYWDALPFTPRKPDTNRAATHRRLLAEARGEVPPPAAPQSSASTAPTKRRGSCR